MGKFFGGLLTLAAAVGLTIGFFSWSVRDRLVDIEFVHEMVQSVLDEPTARDEVVDEATTEILADPSRRALIEDAFGDESSTVVRKLVDRAYDTPEFRSEITSVVDRRLDTASSGGGEVVFNARPAFDAVLSEIDPGEAAAFAAMPDSTFLIQSEVDGRSVEGWDSLRSALWFGFVVATAVGFGSLVISSVLFRSAGPLVAVVWMMAVLSVGAFAVGRVLGAAVTEDAADEGVIDLLFAVQMVERLQSITRLFMSVMVALAILHLVTIGARKLLARRAPSDQLGFGSEATISDWSDSSVSPHLSPGTETAATDWPSAAPVEANWPKIIS